MKFYYLAGEKRLVKSLTDASAPTSFDLMQSDTEDVFVFAVEEVPEDQQDSAAALFREIPLISTVIKLWIGGIELAPTGGTWKAKVGVNETAALGFDVSRTALETALNALASVTSLGGLTVLEKAGTPQASNYYIVQWTNPAVTEVVTFAENKLTPKSRIATYGGTDPDIKTQALVLEQYPPVFTDQFTRPTPAVIIAARLRSGSGVQNEVQTITIPVGSRAIFALVFNSLVTKPLPANSPSREIAAALNALFTDGKERFTARLSRRGVIEVTCTGPLANAAQTLMTVQMIENPSADYAFASLSLKGYRLLLEMRGLKAKTFTLELEINNGIDTKTPLQIPCTIRNDAIPDSVALIPPASEDPAWLEEEPGSTPVHDPSQIVVGNRSYSQLIGGNTNDAGNVLAFTVTHNLNSMQVHVTLTENTGNRRRIEDVVYELRILNANQIRITWKAAPAPAQDTIVALVTAVPEVETFNPHSHFFSEIKKSPADPSVTLDDVITAILAGQNALDVWPLIPVDKIGAGSITADKLDLDSLIAALGIGGVAGERFLAALRELVKDPALISRLLTTLATSEALRETFRQFIERIFSSIKDTQLLREAFLDTLITLPGFDSFLRTAAMSALIRGSALPPETTPIDLAAVDIVFPTRTRLPHPTEERWLYRKLMPRLQRDGQSFEITCTADVAGSLHGKYFVIESPVGAVLVIQIQVGANPPVPPPPADDGDLVLILIASNATAAQVAAAIFDARASIDTGPFDYAITQTDSKVWLREYGSAWVSEGVCYDANTGFQIRRLWRTNGYLTDPSKATPGVWIAPPLATLEIPGSIKGRGFAIRGTDKENGNAQLGRFPDVAYFDGVEWWEVTPSVASTLPGRYWLDTAMQQMIAKSCPITKEMLPAGRDFILDVVPFLQFASKQKDDGGDVTANALFVIERFVGTGAAGGIGESWETVTTQAVHLTPATVGHRLAIRARRTTPVDADAMVQLSVARYDAEWESYGSPIKIGANTSHHLMLRIRFSGFEIAEAEVSGAVQIIVPKPLCRISKTS